MKGFAVCCLLAVMMWGGNAFATPPDAGRRLTLKEAVSIALREHPRIRSAEKSALASGEKVTEVRSSLLPQLNGAATGAFANKNTQIAAPQSGLGNTSVIDRGSFGIAASQLLTDFGRTSSQVESSRSELEATYEQARATREMVVLNVINSYYNVLKAKALLKVAMDTLKARQGLLAQITFMRDSGMKSDLDVSIAKQNVDDANLLLLKAKNAVDDSNASLSEALGREDGEGWELTEKMVIPPPPDKLDPLLEEAMGKNPELSTLRAKQAAARKLAEAEAKAGYPVVKAEVVTGNTPLSDSNQPIEPAYAAAGITLTMPIYTGGRITARERETHFAAEAVGHDLETRSNLLLKDLRVSFNNVHTTFDNIEVKRQYLKNAAEAYNLTLTRYDIGKSSIVDLWQAQLVKTEAEIADSNAGYDYLIQRAILAYLVGGAAEKYTAP